VSEQCFTSPPTQYTVGYTGDSFYRSKDPTNSIKVLKEMLQKMDGWMDGWLGFNGILSMTEEVLSLLDNNEEGRGMEKERITDEKRKVSLCSLFSNFWIFPDHNLTSISNNILHTKLSKLKS